MFRIFSGKAQILAFQQKYICNSSNKW